MQLCPLIYSCSFLVEDLQRFSRGGLIALLFPFLPLFQPVSFQLDPFTFTSQRPSCAFLIAQLSAQNFCMPISARRFLHFWLPLLCRLWANKATELFTPSLPTEVSPRCPSAARAMPTVAAAAAEARPPVASTPTTAAPRPRSPLDLTPKSPSQPC